MPNHRKDYDKAVELYENGMSIADIANIYKMSRQSMHKILKRRGCNFRTNLNYGADNHFYRGGITPKRRASDITEKAILRKKLIPQPCEVCNEFGYMKDGRRNVQAHHDNYNYPLKVRWLCQFHHHEWHKTNKPIKAETYAYN